MKKKVLALDFDGLLCDALNECILVTWNGYHEKDLSAFDDEGLTAIPDKFIERFTYFRNFAKHVGHFWISFLDPSPTLHTQEDFDTLYTSIPPTIINTFEKKVTYYRNWARNEKREQWLNYHTLYAGIKPFLQDLRIPTYIVTAKDSESVIAILKNNDIPFDRAKVFGELHSKLAALGEIRSLEQVDSDQIYFYDDHIMNVLVAKECGYRAHWATWGYNVPTQFRLAKERGIEAIYLNNFVEQRLDLPY